MLREVLRTAAVAFALTGSVWLNSGADVRADPADDARRKDLDRQRAQGTGLVRLPELETYLNGLLEKVQQVGPQPPGYARVFLRSDPEPIAHSTPAGHIYISLGWISSIESEDEAVALLAHEYKHVAAGHLAKNFLGEGGYLAVVASVVVAMAQKKNVGVALPTGLSIWGQILQPSWSRAQEAEADAFALDAVMALGYSWARGPKAFLERIGTRDTPKAAQGATKPAAANTNVLAALAESHPDPAQRLEDLSAKYREQYGSAPRNDARVGPWRSATTQSNVATALAAHRQAAEVRGRLATRDITGALNNALRSNASAPNSYAFVLTNLGMAYLASGDAEKALTALDSAMRLPESGWYPYDLSSSIYMTRGRAESATATLETGFERFGKPIALYPRMIEHYRILRDQAPAKSPAYNSANSKLAGLRLACVLNAEFSMACNDAALTEAEKVQQKAASDRATQERTNRIMEKLKKNLH